MLRLVHLYAFLAVSFVDAFYHRAFLERRCLSSDSIQILKAGSIDEHDDTRKGTACLNLVALASFESSTASLATSEKIFEFFKIETNRNCLVTAGNSKPCETITPSPELFQLWKIKADLTGGTEPNDDDVVLQINTGGIKFPGLTLTSVAMIGCKLVTNAVSSFPEYQFVLIDDAQQVEGAKPVVWIFNQLTGSSKKVRIPSDGPLSITRVSAKLTDDEKGIIFFSEGYLKIFVKFPAFLLRILPVSKEKAEEQGSMTIQKVIEKDVKASILAFRDLYDAW